VGGGGGRVALALLDEHPLLLPQTAPTTELYVRDAPEDVAHLLLDLKRAHDEVTAGWLPFDDFLNRGYAAIGSRPATAGGMGLLARGPRPLLDAYAEVAGRHGMGPRLVGGRDPEPTPLHVLLLGDSWWVAEAFSAERTDPA
jgi:hypothetical protein